MKGVRDVAVIVPVGQRYDDVFELYRAYKAALEETGRSFEFVYVLDGRLEPVFKRLRELQQQGERLKIIRLAKMFGEATALTAGFEHSSGDILLTLPAYYQVEPSAIAGMIDRLDGNDMVIGRRWPRSGSRFESARRRLFHWLIRSVTGIRYRDLGCGVRAFRRKIADEVPIYGDQHRFLPVIANRWGFRILELDVPQSPKDQFRGGYRFREYLHRALDIFTVFFLVRFTKKPLRFFGMVGSITSLVGGVLVFIMVIQRMFFDMALGNRPALLLSSLLVVLGVQIFALGLLGELIIFTHARSIKEYTVELIVNEEAQPERPTAVAERAV
ncbi:MAG: glycosyltransferase [Gammaproteobacteria bacterium]